VLTALLLACAPAAPAPLPRPAPPDKAPVSMAGEWGVKWIDVAYHYELRPDGTTAATLPGAAGRYVGAWNHAHGRLSVEEVFVAANGSVGERWAWYVDCPGCPNRVVGPARDAADGTELAPVVMERRRPPPPKRRAPR
jgi:hypothetical protein